jgi:hypothetical protein
VLHVFGEHSTNNEEIKGKVAVQLFQWYLMTFLKYNINQPQTKIIYFSDSSAAPYKNQKNFDLILHYEDFRMPAEWHFFVEFSREECIWVLVELSKDLQHKPIYNDLIQTKLWLQGSFSTGHI